MLETMTTLVAIRTRALASLIPPPRIALSEWIEANISPKRGQRKGLVDPAVLAPDRREP